MTILDSLVEGTLCLGNRRESNELLGMMVRYLVTGEAPEPRTDAQRMAITLIMPVLENSRARAEAGRKGGLSRGSAASGAESEAESKAASKRASKPASKTASKRASEEEEEEEGELGVWINPSDCSDEGGGGEFVPPTIEEVESYFAANCLRGSARKFFDYYEANGWTRKGFPIVKWEPVARSWSDRELGFDAERKARGGQTSQEVERAAVWQPAKTDDELIAELERQVAEAS